MSSINGGKYIISIIKNNWGKIIILLVVIYLFTPVQIAVNEYDLNYDNDYMIVEFATASECDFHILYDSKGRNINYVVDNNRVLHFFTKFTGFYGDIDRNLNKYVLYTDDNKIERDELIVDDYDINIIYPIKREFKFIYPDNVIFRFETIFPFAF